MTEQSFVLVPFPGEGPTSALTQFRITGKIDRLDPMLSLNYELQGPLTDLLIPAPSNIPTRRDQLWQTTCFEFFLACPQLEPYWEFNLSPAGDWNIYRFDDYRQGMQPELTWSGLSFDVDGGSDRFKLSLNLDLTLLFPTTQPFLIAITAVLQHCNEGVSYWALTHPSSQADFHQRDGFVLVV